MLYKHCVGSFSRVLSFMQAAALGSMGSQLPFAACSSSGYYADFADIDVLQIISINLTAWC
jgi:hypothetical protein